MRTMGWALVTAALASPVAASAGAITYDCDTAANHYSELTFPASRSFAASGKIRLLTMAPSKEYAAIARIVLTNDVPVPGPSDEDWAGFSFSNIATFKPAVPGLLQTTNRKKGAKAEETTLGIASASEIAFRLSYDGALVSLEVDGHRSATPFAAHTPALKIVCSTGEFLIHDLMIENTP
jgi:hypothetical protein